MEIFVFLQDVLDSLEFARGSSVTPIRAGEPVSVSDTYPIRIRHGYATDTYPRSIRKKIKNKKLDTSLDTYSDFRYAAVRRESRLALCRCPRSRLGHALLGRASAWVLPRAAGNARAVLAAGWPCSSALGRLRGWQVWPPAWPAGHRPHPLVPWLAGRAGRRPRPAPGRPRRAPGPTWPREGKPGGGGGEQDCRLLLFAVGQDEERSGGACAARWMGRKQRRGNGRDKPGDDEQQPPI